MSWLLVSPGHQQPWYWLCRMGRSLSYLRKDFNHLCHINVEEWRKMQIYVLCSLWKYLSRKGLISIAARHSVVRATERLSVWTVDLWAGTSNCIPRFYCGMQLLVPVFDIFFWQKILQLIINKPQIYLAFVAILTQLLVFRRCTNKSFHIRQHFCYQITRTVPNQC